MESNADRRRKRIVEHVVSGFRTAHDAIVFGNTVESLVNEHIGKVKFRQSIGSPDFRLAITPEYLGETALKTSFLEVPGDEAARQIRTVVSRVVQTHNAVHDERVSILKEGIREKPQPQKIGFGLKLAT